MNHTLESLLKLAETPEGREEIRAIVAELCGWNREQNPNNGIWMWWTQVPGFRRYHQAGPPDYTDSLDAMAKAKQNMRFSERRWFAAHLIDVLSHKLGGGARVADRELAFTEAWQEAIAFILTKQATA